MSTSLEKHEEHNYCNIWIHYLRPEVVGCLFADLQIYFVSQQWRIPALGSQFECYLFWRLSPHCTITHVTENKLEHIDGVFLKLPVLDQNQRLLDWNLQANNHS